MPKISETDRNLELKLTLQNMLDKMDMLEIILDRDINEIRKQLNKYRLTINKIENLKIEDVDLAFLIGEVLSKYYFIRKILNKYEEQYHFNTLIDGIIEDNDLSFEILSSIYKDKYVLKGELSKKYKDCDSLLISMQNLSLIAEDRKKNFYYLTNPTRRYMKEKYLENENLSSEKKAKQNNLKLLITDDDKREE